MEFLLLWVGLSVLAGWMAARKGRSFAALFLFSLVLSPLFGIVIAVLMVPDPDRAAPGAIPARLMRKCPHCAELIRRDAKVCRYCQRDCAQPPVLTDAVRVESTGRPPH